jgi:CarD family transcriptional regulator
MATTTSTTDASDDPAEGAATHGLRIGQCVVHPQHGTAILVDIEQRTLGGQERTFAVLEREGEDLVLRIPVDALDEIGVRTTVEEDRAEEVLARLGAEPVALSRSWQKRRSRNERLIRTGRLIDAAEVVRDLSAYEAEYDLPSADRHMYEEARARLVNELAVVLSRETEEIEELVDRTLNGDGRG